MKARIELEVANRGNREEMPAKTGHRSDEEDDAPLGQLYPDVAPVQLREQYPDLAPGAVRRALRRSVPRPWQRVCCASRRWLSRRLLTRMWIWLWECRSISVSTAARSDSSGSTPARIG